MSHLRTGRRPLGLTTRLVNRVCDEFLQGELASIQVLAHCMREQERIVLLIMEELAKRGHEPKERHSGPRRIVYNFGNGKECTIRVVSHGGGGVHYDFQSMRGTDDTLVIDHSWSPHRLPPGSHVDRQFLAYLHERRQVFI